MLAATPAPPKTITAPTSEQLYNANHNEMEELCHESRLLFQGDVDNLLEGIAGKLNQFTGTTNQDFMAWASTILQPAVGRLKELYTFRRLYEKSVLAGVWSILRGCLDLADHDDPRHTAQQLANEVWPWIFQNMDALLVPGTAKLSTRLQERARYMAWAWKTSRLRAKRRFVDIADLDKPSRFQTKVKVRLVAVDVDAEADQVEDVIAAEPDLEDETGWQEEQAS